MTFVPFSKLAKSLSGQISLNSEKVDKELVKKVILTEPVLATTTFGKYSDLPLTELADIFEDVTEKDAVFRARFSILKVTPDRVEDYVEEYTPKGSSRSKPVYKVSQIRP